MPIFSWILDCWALVKLGAPILDKWGISSSVPQQKLGLGTQKMWCIPDQVLICHMWVMSYATWLVAFSFNFFASKMGTLDSSLALHRDEIATTTEKQSTVKGGRTGERREERGRKTDKKNGRKQGRETKKGEKETKDNGKAEKRGKERGRKEGRA